MRPIMKPLLSLGCATALLVSAAVPAYAACTEFSFSVNDYGKDGPTRDAKLLLDKWIADWAQRVSLKKYKVGTKSVSCELFLNFVVFDEHTCKATAKVCWSGITYEVLKARAAKNPQKNTITLTKAESNPKGKSKKVAKKTSKTKTTAKQRKARAAALKRKQAQKAAKVAAAKRASKPPAQPAASQRSRREPAVHVVKVKSPSALTPKGANIATGSVTPTPHEPSSSPPVSSARAAAIANARAAAQSAAAAAKAAIAAARAAEAAAKLVEQTK